MAIRTGPRLIVMTRPRLIVMTGPRLIKPIGRAPKGRGKGRGYVKDGIHGGGIDHLIRGCSHTEYNSKIVCIGQHERRRVVEYTNTPPRHRFHVLNTIPSTSCCHNFKSMHQPMHIILLPNPNRFRFRDGYDAGTSYRRIRSNQSSVHF